MSSISIFGPTLTPSGIQNLGVLIEDGFITQVSNNEISTKNVEYLNENQLLLPGIYNWHSHLRDMKQKDRETITTGTEHFLRTGVLETWAMPNTNPALDCYENIRQYQNIIKRDALIPTNIHALLAPYSTKSTINKIVELGIKHFKVFLGKSVGPKGIEFENKEKVKEKFKLLPEGAVVSMHLELGLKKYEHLWDPKNPISHYYARPSQVGIDGAVFVNEELAPEHPDKKIWGCHEGIKEILEMKRADNFLLEFSPQYAYFNNEVFNWKSYLIKCNPAIGNEEDRQATEQGFYNGVFERWGDDHAPHTVNDKWGNHYSGMPAYSGPLLGHFINKVKNEPKKLANILKTYTKPEWEVKDGNPARLMILNLKPKPVKMEHLYTKARCVALWIGEKLPFVEKILYYQQPIITNKY